MKSFVCEDGKVFIQDLIQDIFLLNIEFEYFGRQVFFNWNLRPSQVEHYNSCHCIVSYCGIVVSYIDSKRKFKSK